MIYGIMNITPDSFFDGGQYKTKDDVLNHVDAMLQAGADVIEVNGQTTRPGFTEVTPQVEWTGRCRTFAPSRLVSRKQS